MSEDTSEARAYSFISITPVDRNDPFGAGFTFSMNGTRVLAVSPDGRWLAFGGWDETIQVCELVTGGRSLTYRGHKAGIQAIEWSPDGRYIASAGSQEEAADIQVWEATTGQVRWSLDCDEEGVMCLAWSFDGLHLAFGSGQNTVHLLNASTGETEYVYRGQRASPWIKAVAWSPDGTRIASSGLDGSVQVWQTSDESGICRYLGHYGGVNTLAWSPDGTLIVSGGDDKTVQAWDASTREPRWTYNYHSERVMHVGWSRDGQRVRSGSWDGTLRELDARTGEYLPSFHFPHHYEAKAMLFAFAWNLDMTTVAMGLEDRRALAADRLGGKLWICRAPTAAAELVGQGHKEEQTRSHTVHYRPSVKLWGGVEREIVTYRGHTGAVKTLAWSPDGQWLASGGYDNILHVWEANSGKVRMLGRGHRDPIIALAWSPDGQNLATGSLDTTVKVWDVESGRQTPSYYAHPTGVVALAWAPAPVSPARLVSSSEDGTIEVWDLEGTTLLTYKGHQDAVEALAWSPDGRLLASAGTDDTTVQVWDATTGETVYTYRGHTGGVLSIAWSPDGTRIVSGSDWGHKLQEDGTFVSDNTPTVHIWDALSGNNPISCDENRHQMRMNAVAWSPDGRLAAAGDTSGRIHVYDAATGEIVTHIFPHGHGDRQLGMALALAWSPDGQHIAASFSGGLVRVWPTH